MKLSIVIPCYNEEENISLLLEKFAPIAAEIPLELVLVDNGSFDGSAKIFDAELPKYDFATTTKVEVNQGYGYGILQGLKVASGDYMGWTHADLQTDPSDILKAYEILKANDFSSEIFIKGNRIERPLFDRIFTWGMGLFETLYFAQPLFDISAQPNIFHKNYLNDFLKAPYDFAIEIFTVIKAKQLGLKIKKFDVLFLERHGGESSWNDGMLKSKFKFVFTIIKSSIALKQRFKEGLS